MEIDFARVCPVLPPGQQWENRDAVTDFMRSVRSMLLRVGERRGRPCLLAARVPENLVGCRMDGLDVETWAREELVDIFTLGCRSFDVDVAAFRRITEGTHIRLYPVLDDHHSTDGYRFPPIEVFRGVMANWLHQGADGLQTFNFAYARSETLEKYGMRDTWTGWTDAPPVLPRACRPRRHESKGARSSSRRGAVAVTAPSSFRTPRTGRRRDGCTSIRTCSLLCPPNSTRKGGRTLSSMYTSASRHHPMRRSRSGCSSRTSPLPTCLMANACSASSWQPSDTRTAGWRTCRPQSASS